MNKTYREINLQYAVHSSLPSWGDLEGWNRDPLFEKYFWLSPYAYCANNPLRFVDPSGKDVEITGTEQKAAFKDFKVGASQHGVKVKIDKNGQISGKYIGKGEISERGQQILNAINDKNIKVKINATDGNKTDGEALFFGGAFLGSTLNVDGTATARQDVNPADLNTMDSYYDKPQGQGMLHEVMEAYNGGLISRTGKSVPNSVKDYNTFLGIHNSTSVLFPQSGDVQKTPIEYFLPNVYGGYDQIGIRYELSAPGKTTKTKDVYK